MHPTTVLAAARLTRLVTTDTWPPVLDLTAALEARLPARWAHGLSCPYCVAFWAVTAAHGLSKTRPGRTLNRLLAASYAAAWIVRADTGWKD